MESYRKPVRSVQLASLVTRAAVAVLLVLAMLAHCAAKPQLDEKSRNALGYRLLSQGRTAEAIEVFRENVRAYPRSGNAYDSLAEAYLANKETGKAIANYRNALALLPGDDRIIDTLARLGAPLSAEETAASMRALVPADVEFLPDIVYGRKTLHILRPKARSAALPALLYIHGGGWTEGRKERGFTPLLHFVQRGSIGVMVSYRLTGEAIFPAQIEDIKCAIRFLRANAVRYGIDPQRIAVWGQSAGGHLAALAGTSAGEFEGGCEPRSVSSRPDAVIDWNGPTDLLEPRELERLMQQKAQEGAPTIAIERLLGGSVENRELARLANPITWVSPDDPPFLILHGDADTAVDVSQSRALYYALRKAGVDATLRVFEGEKHFGVSARHPMHEKFSVEMDAFLDRVF